MSSLIVLYDADCGVCRYLLGRILTWDRADNLRVLALQTDEARELLASVPQDEWMTSWHLVDRSGAVHSAGNAFPLLFADLPGGSVLSPAARLLQVPISLAYRTFAANRSFFGQFVPEAAKARAQAKIDARS